MTEYKSGYVHSIETMGLLDGPNIRVVIFFQGCPLRCVFCHNPDTWLKCKANKFNSKEILDEIKKYKHYIEEGGGVTFSGGEPLYQSEFLLETLKMCKKEGIHTCIDTSGTGYNKNVLEEILKYTDLVLLDIKAIDEVGYKNITGKEINEFNYFKQRLNESNKKVWIRQVIIPGINDTMEYIKGLKKYINSIKNIEKVELLPYHTMAIPKYKEMNIKYKLENVPDMDIEICKKMEDSLN